MAVSVTVPVSTEVIEQNLDSKITGAYEEVYSKVVDGK